MPFATIKRPLSLSFLSPRPPTAKIRHSLFRNMTTDKTISSCRSLHNRHEKPASNIIKKQCVRYCDNQSSTASSTLQESVETVIRHEITSDKSNITNISPQNNIRTRKSSRHVHYLLRFAQTKCDCDRCYPMASSGAQPVMVKCEVIGVRCDVFLSFVPGLRKSTHRYIHRWTTTPDPPEGYG